MEKDIKQIEMSNDELMKKWLSIFGKNVDKAEIESAQFENEKLVAFDKALKYLSAIKSEKQVKDYLFGKGYAKKNS